MKRKILMSLMKNCNQISVCRKGIIVPTNYDFQRTTAGNFTWDTITTTTKKKLKAVRAIQITTE